jgi:transcriptional antiterminator NusG
MAVACAFSNIQYPSDELARNNGAFQSNGGMHEREERIQWYAIRTKPKHEKVTDISLGHKGFESFLPLYCRSHGRAGRRKHTHAPVFPGYLFCRFDANARLPILTTPGVLYIVGIGRTPAPVPESEVESVRRLVNSGVSAEPWPYLEVGQRVYIKDGPLQGVIGVLSGLKNANRLVVSVTLLRRAVSVEIDRDWALPGVLAPVDFDPKSRAVAAD